MKAKAAMESNRFKDEIVPVSAPVYGDNTRSTVDFSVDELPRPETTKEGLAELKPSFALKGTVTPGNASPLSDGAAACLVMSGTRAAKLGLKPLAVFRGYATAGVDPAIMGIGPVPAIRKLVARTGVALSNVDVIELNEAFACQALYCQRTLEIDEAKLNINGGAIALGHPLGATGAKLTATALYELKRRGGKYAIVSMCIGGGQGAAGLFERA
jgi:acetyl-CoA acyltransferase